MLAKIRGWTLKGFSLNYSVQQLHDLDSVFLNWLKSNWKENFIGMLLDVV